MRPGRASRTPPQVRIRSADVIMSLLALEHCGYFHMLVAARMATVLLLATQAQK